MSYFSDLGSVKLPAQPGYTVKKTAAGVEYYERASASTGAELAKKADDATVQYSTTHAEIATAQAGLSKTKLLIGAGATILAAGGVWFYFKRRKP